MQKTLILALSFILLAPNISLAVDPVTTTCDDNLTVPVVEATLNDNNILLSWNQIDHADLSGYKLVISKDDSTPSYPNNGYLKYITNRETTSYTINNSTAYNDGDIVGGYLEGGEDYYFTVTAVYGCGQKVTGNILHLTYPGASVSDDENEDIEDEDLSDDSDDTASVRDKAYTLYRDHVSCGTDEPVNVNQVIKLRDASGRMLYGNFRCINRYQEQCVNDGSFDTYYKEYCTDVNGTVIKVDESSDDTQITYPIPVVNASSSEDGILLSWDKINHDAFTGYKVVISKSNKKPQYPDHGYARYITDPNTTSILLNNSSEYVRGDFGGYLQPGDSYYLSITALYGHFKVTGNAVLATYHGPSHKVVDKPKSDSLIIYKEKAEQLVSNDLGDILDELQELRDKLREQENEIKYLRSLLSDVKSITQSVKDTLNQFITYGVDENTKKLGEGERAAVIYSFKSAFNKLPETEDEVADAIKIANGRWPSQTSETAENRAKNEFRKIYLREADMTNPNDNAAVTVMTYGLRQKAENRNLNSEKQGIKTFQYIYGRLPQSTEDWNIMQAITYSGASR